MADRVPVSVLTGFLGSGKTTLLRRVLASPAMADTAVVVNEFGAVGLDHLLLAASSDEIVRLPGGCLCCVLRQDLARTLLGLLGRRAAGGIPPFRRIAVETSGLAEPAPILHTLAADPALEGAVRLDTVLTVVDAVLGRATLARHAEATAQATVADRIFVSKTDLAPPSEALLAELAALNPSAAIVPGPGASDPSPLLFGGGGTSLRAPPPLRAAAHTRGIATVTLRFGRAMTRLEFARALGGLARERGEDLLRAKGLVAFADAPGGPAAIHAVQHTLYRPDWLPEWPDEDRTSRMVFIVRDMAPELLLARFAAGCPSSS